MSRIYPLEGLLLNLDEKIQTGRREYMTKDEAYEKLKSITGQDFGYDSKKWKDWIKNNREFLQRQRRPSR